MKHEDLFRKAGALALSAGISAVVGDMGVGLLVKFLADMSGKYLENLEMEKIRAVLRTTHPSELNHHLQKALDEAIANALKNIEVLYTDIHSTKDQKKAVLELTSGLRTAVTERLRLYYAPTDSGIVTLIDDVAEQSGKQLAELLDDAVDELPAIDEENPYPAFFRQQFVPQLQFCFGEELKKPSNHEAWVAYQRLLTKQLKASAQDSLQLSQQMNQKLDELTQQRPISLPRMSKEKLNALRDLVATLDNTEIRLEDRFKTALDSLVSDLSDKMDQVLEQTKQTHRRIERLYQQQSQTQTKVDQFGHQLQQNWVSKHTTALLIGVVLLVVAGVSLYTYIRSQSFDKTAFVKADPALQLHKNYPVFDGGELVIRLGSKEERRQILNNGEVIFTQLPANFRNSYVPLRLLNPNWQTQVDSLLIDEAAATIYIVPTNRLAVVAGIVRNSDGTQGIPLATVMIDGDTTVTTNREGSFSVTLPYRMRKTNYRLNIWKAGFGKLTDEYVPDSSIPEFRLTAK